MDEQQIIHTMSKARNELLDAITHVDELAAMSFLEACRWCVRWTARIAQLSSIDLNTVSDEVAFEIVAAGMALDVALDQCLAVASAKRPAGVGNIALSLMLARRTKAELDKMAGARNTNN